MIWDLLREVSSHTCTTQEILCSDVFTTTQKSLERSGEGGGGVQHTGGRMQSFSAAEEITCFCLEHIDTCIGPYHTISTSLSALTCTSLLFHPEIYLVFLACKRVKPAQDLLLCSHVSSSGLSADFIWGGQTEKVQSHSDVCIQTYKVWRIPVVKCLSESSFREQGARWLIYNVIIMLLLI